MQVSSFLDNVTEIEEQSTERKQRSVLISGYVNSAPSDVINFVEVTNLEDVLKSRSFTDCLMFKEELCDIIRMIVDYPSVFDFRLVVLSGVPDCDYSSAFESACYNRARVSFHSVVNDVREQMERERGVLSESNGIYGKEQARIRRSDGSVKELGEVARGHDESDIADEEE